VTTVRVALASFVAFGFSRTDWVRLKADAPYAYVVSGFVSYVVSGFSRTSGGEISCG